MPRSTNVNRYPPQYFDFITRFENGEGEFHIPSKHAGADRLELYAFRSALRKSERASEFPKFDAAEIIADAANDRVIVRAKERNPTALALSKAVANNEPKEDNT